VQPVAWDFIAPAPAAIEAVQQADYLIVGTLASRSPVSADTVKLLAKTARKVVVDVNLRKPFIEREAILVQLQTAALIKMNDEELETFSNWLGFSGSAQEQMQALYARFRPAAGLIVTRGAAGAWAVNESGFQSVAGVPVTVQDTIGSGDAFLAGFLSRLAQGKALPECLSFAAAMGAFVATQAGGTPAHTDAIRALQQ
jgi:fructokinase